MEPSHLFVLRRTRRASVCLLTSIFLLAPLASARAQVFISEIVTADNSLLPDSDGDFGDWIELCNLSKAAVDLAGWSLTDDADEPGKWVFPAVTIEPGGFLVVFASGKDRAAPGAPLHTSFNLSRLGEYLALIEPDGVTLADSFEPAYPRALPEHSFGVPFETTLFIGPDAEARILIPTGSASASDWTSPTFELSDAWFAGGPGVGFNIADLKSAGDLLVHLDAEDLQEAFDGAAAATRTLQIWPNRGSLGEFRATLSRRQPHLRRIAGELAVEFDGLDDLLRSASDAPETITNTDDWSIEVWAYNPEIDSRETLVNWAALNGPSGRAAALNYGNSESSGALTHWGTRDMGFAGGAPEAGTWRHIVATYGGESSRLERVYVDGALNTSRTQSLALHGIHDDRGFPIVLGAAANDSTLENLEALFSGALAVVRIHAAEMTPEQVANNYRVDAERFGHADAEAPNATSALIATDLEDEMRDQNASALIRFSFQADAPGTLDALTLRMWYNDGFVAYLNGAEVARRNAPAELAWDSSATTRRATRLATRPEALNLTESLGLLRPGENVLAIHGLNVSADDATFRILPELVGAAANREARYYLPEATPGKANIHFGQDFAPFVLDMKHAPALPQFQESVTVSARILDDGSTEGLAAVHLYHRLDGGQQFVETPMLDDGQHGDGRAGDGVYGATLDAQSTGTIVEFYIEAEDGQGNRGAWPPDRQANAVYQIQEPPSAADLTRMETQPLYHLTMTQAHKTRLEYLLSNEPESDETVPATFTSIHKGEALIRYGVAVRNRGNGSRVSNPHNYRVEFLDEEPWKGVDAININSRNTHAQIVAAALCRAAGLETADASAVRVRVNGRDLSSPDGGMFGSYAHLEAIDSDFAARHFPSDPDGNIYKCIGHQSTLEYLGDDPDPYRLPYAKHSNRAEDDFSDVMSLTRILSSATPDDEYVARVESVVDVDAWLLYFAVNALMDSSETSLANGYGDDYYMYRGRIDPRFRLVPHDWDSVLGENGSHPDSGIFRAADLPVIGRFLKEPQFVRRYYATLLALLEGAFAPERADKTIDRAIGDYVPARTIASMKDFVHRRKTRVLQLIPQRLAVENPMPIVSGYFRTTKASLESLSGLADAARTQSVLVNDKPANWSAFEAEWKIDSQASTEAIALAPGINNILIRAFDGPQGSGNEIERIEMQIWRDDGFATPISGTLNEDTTLTLGGSPWKAEGDLIVEEGATLRIEPGAGLFFEAGTGLIVRGRLAAQGASDAPIRLSGAAWNGVQFLDSSQENVLSHVHIESANGAPGSIRVERSTVTLRSLAWRGSREPMLDASDSSLDILDSQFILTSSSGAIRASRIAPGGRLVVRGCVFDAAATSGSILQVSDCRRPDPIALIEENTFRGGGVAIALEGADVHIEGNAFERTGAAAMVAQKLNETPCDLVAVRNTFFSVARAALLGGNCRLSVAHNTIVASEAAPFGILGAGAALRIDGSIVWDGASDALYETLEGGSQPAIEVDRSIVPATAVDFGEGNSSANPLLSDPANGDFSLLAGSPALGAGPHGFDMGALVAPGASFLGAPERWTTQRAASLTIVGPGLTHYRYRLTPFAPYSAERPIDSPILLDNVGPGDVALEVQAKNSAGLWLEATSRATWRVLAGDAALRVTELMIDPPEPEPREERLGFIDNDQFEFIELQNISTRQISLSSVSIADGIRFAFPSGASLAPGSCALVVRNRAAFALRYGLDLPVAGEYSGRLSNRSDALRIATPNGSTIEIEYELGRGWPLAARGGGHSLVPLAIGFDGQTSGSLSYGGNWRASAYAGGSPGYADPDPAARIQIDEFAAYTAFDALPRVSNDWIELRNPGAEPLTLTNWFLSNDAEAPRKWAIPNGTTIAAGERLRFSEIGGFRDPLASGFSLWASGQQVVLSNLAGAGANQIVDAVEFAAQPLGATLGRDDEAGGYWQALAPTPGAPNAAHAPSVVIGEFHYNPLGADAGAEFIELYNATRATVRLGAAGGEWRLAGAASFLFQPGVSIAPGGVLLVVGFDPGDADALAAFRGLYDGEANLSAAIVGPFAGVLSNRGGRVAIERPQDTTYEGFGWIIEDEVFYFDQAPWPSAADGTGLGLTRAHAERSGSDPSAWRAETPTPGRGPAQPAAPSAASWVLY